MTSILLNPLIHSQLLTYLTVQQHWTQSILPSRKHLFWLLRNHFFLVSFLAGFSSVFPWHLMLVPVHLPDYFSSLPLLLLRWPHTVFMALNTIYILTTSKFVNLIQTTILNFRPIDSIVCLTDPPDYRIVILDLCPKLISWSPLMAQTCCPYRLLTVVNGCFILAQIPNLWLCFDSSFSFISHI